MPFKNGWSEYRLGDIASVHRGLSWSTKQERPEPLPGSVAVLRIPNVKERLDISDVLHLVDVDESARQQCLATKNWTLLVSSNGNPDRVGDCVFIDTDNDFVFASFLVALTSKDADLVRPDYLYRLLKSDAIQRAISRNVQGSTGLSNINLPLLLRQPISLPSITVQTFTCELLKAVDNAIERTRAVIDQTRKLKTALLQDLLTNGLPGRRNGHQKVRWLGKAPKAWQVCTLGELVREPIRNGYSPNCPSRPTGRWVLSLSAVSVEGYRSTGVKPAPPHDPKVLDSQLERGDILVSRSNTRELVGLAGAYDGTPSNCSYPDLLMRVRVEQSKANPDYVLAALLSGGSRSYFAHTSRGTSGSMKKIDREILKNLPIPLPPSKDQDEIVRINDAMSRRVRDEVAFMDRAELLKNALSQALLTGRVRVPAAMSSHSS